MTAVDYTLLFDRQKPLLWVMFDTSLDANETLRWLILDAHNGNELYARVATLDHAISFARAAKLRGDATIDEVSIAMAVNLIDMLVGHSLKVPSLEGEPTGGRVPAAPDRDAASVYPVSQTTVSAAESASPSMTVRGGHSPLSPEPTEARPGNILPFKRRLVV